jgi:hypothetical protein
MSDAPKTVPSGLLRVEIDYPMDQHLTTPKGEIRGWFAARDVDLPENFRFEVGTMPVPFQAVKREDVEAMLPYHAVAGFIVRYDLTAYLPYIDGLNLIIRLILPEYQTRSLRFRIEPRALASCLASASEF